MRRTTIIALAVLLLIVPVASRLRAQDNWQEQTYRNEALGLTFQYPAGWEVREQLPTRSVLAGSKADIDAVSNGKAPTGLLFTVTMSTFQRIGATQLDDFTPILQKIAQTNDAVPENVKI